MITSDTAATRVISDADGQVRMMLRSFRLTIGDGRVIDHSGACLRVGSREGNDVVLADDGVSRIHFEIASDSEGFRLRDLGSTNGTKVDGYRASDVYLRPLARIVVSRTEMVFEPLAEEVAVELAEVPRFGPLVGQSAVMRKLFAILERAAPSSATVLVEGESGTGKELVARALHDASPRAAGPYVVFDCAAVPDNLLESELFGHERGAFTGASERRIGCMEEADGGTLFLDELGELPLQLQGKLLRAVENREFRRVGAQERRKVDVRFVAATNRDLAQSVNDGTFREDLYHRLAVIRVVVPPLRERRDDIPLLVRCFVDRAEADAARAKATVDGIADEIWRKLREHRWPGNVRELRNTIERAIILGSTDMEADATDPSADPPSELAVDVERSFLDQKNDMIAQFEAAYLRRMLAACDGKIARAAGRAGIDRGYFKRLMKKHGL